MRIHLRGVVVLNVCQSASLKPYPRLLFWRSERDQFAVVAFDAFPTIPYLLCEMSFKIAPKCFDTIVGGNTSLFRTFLSEYG